MAGIVAGILGGLIGIATLRLDSIFLAFATLGLSEVIRILIQNWIGLTGGPMGIANIPVPLWFGKPLTIAMYYYFVLIVAVLIVLFVRNIANSNTGRTLMSIREDENAARSMGIDVFRYKLLTMVFSCFIAGIAGSIFAHFLQFISATMFTINESINMIAMVAVGGMGTVLGPVYGALLLTIIPEIFRFLAEYRQMMYGGVLVVTIIFAPKGIVGFLNNLLTNPKIKQK
jgi:branched-chain amino acid transport system permease protein